MLMLLTPRMLLLLPPPLLLLLAIVDRAGSYCFHAGSSGSAGSCLMQCS